MTPQPPQSLRPIDLLPLLSFTPPLKRILLLFLSLFIFLALLGISVIIFTLANPYAFREQVQSFIVLSTCVCAILAIGFWIVHDKRGRAYLEAYRTGLRAVPQSILIRAAHSPELTSDSHRAILAYLNHQNPGWSLTEEAQREGVLPMPEEKDHLWDKIIDVMKSIINPKS